MVHKVRWLSHNLRVGPCRAIRFNGLVFPLRRPDWNILKIDVLRDNTGFDFFMDRLFTSRNVSLFIGRDTEECGHARKRGPRSADVPFCSSSTKVVAASNGRLSRHVPTLGLPKSWRMHLDLNSERRMPASPNGWSVWGLSRCGYLSVTAAGH